jgi:hypothetical protein
MVDEGDRPDDVDPTGQWGQICLRFHDLRRGAREFGWGDRFRTLSERPGGDLAEWLILAENIRVRKQQVLGVAMQSIDDHVAELARRGIAEDDQRSREYVCPDGRCSRRAAALFDEAPTCELLGRPMEKSQP